MAYHIPDEVFADAHLAAAAQVYSGTEWHAPIDAAVRAAVDRFFADTTADDRLLGMLKSLPAGRYAAAARDGHTEVTDDRRVAFQAGCDLITEAVAQWLTTHTLVALPPVTTNTRGELVVEIPGTDQAVAGYRDTNGTLVIETSQTSWTTTVAHQVAAATLAIERALTAPARGCPR